ncbi:MAG: hypothetical protein HYR67_16635 [Bacteroidetes bacterium]|nr:hypothetical protein [Bacteroidota bacterium]
MTILNLLLTNGKRISLVIRIISLLSCLFLYQSICAQVICNAFSIGEVYEMSKALDFSKMEPLTYKNYPSFNFKDFKPLNGTPDESDFVKVGFNKKNDVREIIYYNKNDSLASYRMLVFNYEDRRILTLGGLEERMTGYSYWPVVFMMDKRNNFNYLIGTSNMVRHLYVSRIWIEEFNRISSVMILDENLLPKDLFRIRNEHVVLYSEIKCLENEVTDEYVHLYSIQNDHEDLKIDFSTCPEMLRRTCRDETPDLSFHVCPSSPKNKLNSIWIRLLAANGER